MSERRFTYRDHPVEGDYPLSGENLHGRRISLISDYLSAILPYAIILAALTARLVPGPRTIDDSYITYRYARNILAGNGFVYNPGEHVLGTTTPLYTILLAALGTVTGGTQAPFAQISLVTNSLADALTCILLWRLGRRLGSEVAGIGAALGWAIAPYSVTFAIGGLETSLYVLLLIATTSAYLEKRFSLAAVTASLAILTRPDAVLLVGPLILGRLIQFWRSVKLRFQRVSIGDENIQKTRVEITRFFNREVAPFSSPLLAWYSFAWMYFGSPIPHSVAAKGLAYHLEPAEGFIRLIQHYATPFMGHLTFGNWWIGAGLILYPFLYTLGSLKALRNQSHAWPVLLYPWLYFAAFAIVNPLIFRWYLTPPLPFYFLIIFVGTDRLITDVLKRFVDTKPISNRLGNSAKAFLLLVVILIPVVLLSKDWTWQPDHGLRRPAPTMAWYQLELLYKEAAKKVQPYLKANTVLAAGDVGVLGFETNAHILDTVGLNSAETLDYYPIDPSYYVTNYAVPPDLILEKQPDLIVILEVYGREGLLKKSQFWEDYHLLEKIPTDIYGSDGMLIFARNS